MKEGEEWGPHQRVLNEAHRRNPNRPEDRCPGTLRCESVEKAYALLVCDACNRDEAVPAMAGPAGPDPEPAAAGVQDDIPF